MKKRNAFKSSMTRLLLDHVFRGIISLMLILACACSGLKANTGASAWPNSTPEEQGMDSKMLLKMLDFIDAQKYTLHSFLILRHGTLVFEAYYPPFQAQDKHIQFSTSKSFTSALVGIALKEGLIKSVDQPVLDFFQDASIKDRDQKINIHIHDLLNMTSGLSSNDNMMAESADWAQFTLNQRSVSEPGSSFNYNTGNTQLLSAIVQKTSGKSAFTYAKEKLFDPLGINDSYWAADPSGVIEGGVGLMLTARDMAKFGYLYLHKGQWKGIQIIPAEWVEASTQKNDNGYAYQWWQSSRGYYALGYAGQMIYVFPSKDLVVVSTAEMPVIVSAVTSLAEGFVFGAAQSDQALPASPAAKELSDRLAAIANPKAQAVPALPAVASSVNGKILTLEDNPLGWKTAQLAFEGSQAYLTITTAANPAEQKFAVGLDGLYRMTGLKKVDTLSVPKPKQRYFLNPYEFNFLLGMPVDGAVAMKGDWSGENKFVLTVQDTRDFDLEEISFQFTSQGAAIDWISSGEGVTTDYVTSGEGATQIKLNGTFD